MRYFPDYRQPTLGLVAALSLVGGGLVNVATQGQAAAQEASHSSAASQPIAEVMLTPSQVEWLLRLQEKYTYVTLSIETPDGTMLNGKFTPGEPIVFSPRSPSGFRREELDDGRDPAAKTGHQKKTPAGVQPGILDGQYSSELRVIPSSPPLTYSYFFRIKDRAILIPPQEPGEQPLKSTRLEPKHKQ